MTIRECRLLAVSILDDRDNGVYVGVSVSIIKYVLKVGVGKWMPLPEGGTILPWWRVNVCDFCGDRIHGTFNVFRGIIRGFYTRYD